ncbi:MAG TPA: 7-carboxy-7-deazaguanine synthase [Pseudolabrys sp.]|nr:7-carboxy-7-deazaguanine synthase [Pseudolabrys sp.]
MSYAVKEIFKTLQGEGGLTGRVAVFCRFAGCNLWSGREEDRASAVCNFCDTDFVGIDGVSGGRYPDASTLAEAIAREWGRVESRRFVVLTGGEPLLQVDNKLVEALHARRFEIAVETNGTIEPPANIDWLCVSPKANAGLKIKSGDELKLVYPQPGVSPTDFIGLSFSRFSLQPMDGINARQNAAAAIAYCLNDPRWQLSIQSHKSLGIR